MISSKDRTNSNDPTYNFWIQFQNPVNIKHVQLANVQIPMTQYNVSSTSNVLVINWNSTNYTLTVPVGIYSPATLATELNTLAQANINSNITVSFNSTNYLFTFNFSSASPNTGALVLSSSTLNYFLGFGAPNTGGTTPSATSISSTTVANDMMNQYLLINLAPMFGGCVQLSNGQKYTFWVPITVNSGAMLNYAPKFEHDMKIKLSDTYVSVSMINIQLYDQFMNYVNLNGSEWAMILKIFKD